MSVPSDNILLEALSVLLEKQTTLEEKYEKALKNQDRIILMQTMLAKRVAQLQRRSAAGGKAYLHPKETLITVH